MSKLPMDPRIVHVASELDVALGPEVENDGNVEYIIDVIAAVDYANEMCGTGFADALAKTRDAVLGIACSQSPTVSHAPHTGPCYVPQAQVLAAITGAGENE